MKICMRCKQEKEDNEFIIKRYFSKKMQDYKECITNWCKDCTKNYEDKYRERRKNGV